MIIVDQFAKKTKANSILKCFYAVKLDLANLTHLQSCACGNVLTLEWFGMNVFRIDTEALLCSFLYGSAEPCLLAYKTCTRKYESQKSPQKTRKSLIHPGYIHIFIC